jgi:hypothetical protein
VNDDDDEDDGVEDDSSSLFSLSCWWRMSWKKCTHTFMNDWSIAIWSTAFCLSDSISVYNDDDMNK